LGGDDRGSYHRGNPTIEDKPAQLLVLISSDDAATTASTVSLKYMKGQLGRGVGRQKGVVGRFGASGKKEEGQMCSSSSTSRFERRRRVLDYVIVVVLDQCVAVLR
jgi:hypothetical protein